MGLKAGLRLLQRTGKVATEYVDDAAKALATKGDDVAIAISKKPPAKPTLRYTSDVVGDTLDISQTSSLARIKKGVMTYAPANKQKEILGRFDEFITNQDDLLVLDKLFKATQNEFNNLPEEKLIKIYNKYFKNLKILRDNNPADYELMVKGGFFDLVEQGKIPLQNFDTNFSKARLSRALLEDLRKVANGEDFIKKVDNLTFENIQKLVKSGEVYSKNGRLFTHNHGLEQEIHLSEDKFLELFPPVLRHISNQGNIGNCWVVGRLDNLMSTQSGVSGIYSLFRQSGDDIFIKFANTDKEILFPKGQILKTQGNKQMATIPGLAMLEQALAVHLGGKYASGSITDITRFAKNPNRLMKMQVGSNFYSVLRRNLFGSADFMHTVSGEYMAGVTLNSTINAYRPANKVSLWEELCCFFGAPFGMISKKTRQANKNIMSDIIDSQANAKDLKIGLSFSKKTPSKYLDLYNMVPDHELTLKSIEDGTCWLSNPWFNWIEKGVDKKTLLTYLNNIHFPMSW